jgi:hypothetical protein
MDQSWFFLRTPRDGQESLWQITETGMMGESHGAGAGAAEGSGGAVVLEIGRFQKGNRKLTLCPDRTSLHESGLIAFSKETMPKILKDKTKMHVATALAKVAEPVGHHAGVVRDIGDISTMLKMRYWQRANVVGGVADFLVRAHSSAWTPTGKVTACLKYYGKPKSAVVQWKGNYVVLKGLVEVWWAGPDFTAQSEPVAIIQKLVERPKEPSMPHGFLAFEEAGVPSMVALEEVLALTIYASTVSSTTKVAAIVAPWVGDHTSHQMASK